MKKRIFLTILLIMSISSSVFSFLHYRSNPESKKTAKKVSSFLNYGQLPGEDTLYLIGDTVHPSTANREWTLMNTSLFIYHNGANTVIDSGCNKIDTLYLRGMYDTAIKKKTGSHYITVLQIKYGIHSHAIKLYYKALCLTRDSLHTTGTKYGYYSNHNKFDSVYYTYSPQGFTKASYKNQFLPDSLSYVDSIRIRHHAGGPIGNFYPPNPGDTDDVSSVIYNFQEIYGLVKNNAYSRYIKTSNVAITVTVMIGGINKYFTKQAILLGPSDLPPAKTSLVTGSGLFYNMYADLEGLCPPSCSEIQYQLQ